ncbi:hypothetical protein [Achromobacter sp. ACRQX]|uniref:hypothetical protein n=1 Tax=Achromobacter sp. ACRQX TaxID=2918181 RepID=UPI001EF23FE5|nr:hypothetical protein [Achromobacter sp. ACRQX]MCG7324621.1 hypothetical protein [Achromobacter sp. ACRQX]
MRLIVVAVPVLAVVGAATLSLLGYGVATAIETTFGIPRELTYNSPLGLLHLSSHAIAGWVEYLDLLFESKEFKRIVWTSTVVGTFVTAIFLFWRFFSTRKRPVSGNRRVPRRIAFHRFVRIPVTFGRWLVKEKLFLLPFLACAVAPWLVIAILTAASLSFALLPLLGHGLAARSFHSWVVSADYCAPLSNREERLRQRHGDVETRPSAEIKVTTCLSLWKDGEFVTQGRHIASTDKNIILFDPASGDVRFEPMEGISVRISGMSAAEMRILIENRKSHGGGIDGSVD